MNTKILIVDDQADVLESLSLNLSSEGYIVCTALCGAEAMAKIRRTKPDLILLDIILDDISGIKLAAKLKKAPETANIPIILLTAKDTETDIVVGLSIGADDYITKPFNVAVLLARIEAVLRRAYPDIDKISDFLSAGPVKIIPANRQVLVGNESIDVTCAEYAILFALIEAGGAIISRKKLKDTLGGTDRGQNKRIIDVHIATLRKKLGSARNIIKTVHTQGYRIDI